MLENKENDNSTLIMITIFFSIFLICIVSIFAFYRIKGFSKTKSDNNIIEEESANAIYLENNDLEVITSILEDTNFLELIISKNNINDINNSELLYYLIKVTESQSQFGKIDNVPANVIDEIHNNSLFKNINYNHSDIILNNNLMWAFDEKNNIYIKNNIEKRLITIPILIRLNEINTVNNNEYILSYKYAFKTIGDNNIYGSYTDALNQTAPIYLDVSNNIEVLRQELNNKYNDMKEKLNTYTYEIEIDNNNKYILKSFNIKNNT